MNKKTIAIFGGSFDPIHIGHILFTNFLIDENMVDKVWLTLSEHHTLKDLHYASLGNRKEMCDLAIEEKNLFGKVETFISPWSKSIDLFQFLSENFPNFNFVFVIGQDCAEEVEEKWAYGKELIDKVPFIVFARKGYDLSTESRWYTKKPHRFLKTYIHSESNCLITTNSFLAKNVSSSEIRKAFLDNSFNVRNKGHLLKSTLKYINTNNLY